MMNLNTESIIKFLSNPMCLIAVALIVIAVIALIISIRSGFELGVMYAAIVLVIALIVMNNGQENQKAKDALSMAQSGIPVYVDENLVDYENIEFTHYLINIKDDKILLSTQKEHN